MVIADLLFFTRNSEAPQAHVDLRRILVSTLLLVRAGAAKTTRIETALAETALRSRNHRGPDKCS